MKSIGVGNGGTVKMGETFDWQNTGSTAVEITACGAFLTQQFYTVPAQSGSTPGTCPATVKTGIQPGQYSYTESSNIKGTNPKMTVNSEK